MKVLQIDGYFLLPDDFEGSMSDAIELLAKYDREKEDILITNEGSLWDLFLQGMDRGKRLTINKGIQKWTGTAWEQMDGK